MSLKDIFQGGGDPLGFSEFSKSSAPTPTGKGGGSYRGGLGIGSMVRQAAKKAKTGFSGGRSSQRVHSAPAARGGMSRKGRRVRKSRKSRKGGRR